MDCVYPHLFPELGVTAEAMEELLAAFTLISPFRPIRWTRICAQNAALGKLRRASDPKTCAKYFRLSYVRWLKTRVRSPPAPIPPAVLERLVKSVFPTIRRDGVQWHSVFYHMRDDEFNAWFAADNGAHARRYTLEIARRFRTFRRAKKRACFQ
jgi:hypothetical protein